MGMNVPAPRWITTPALTAVLLVRSAYYFLVRVFFCEPLFKAYCAGYGRNFHTGAFLHWVQGKGEILIGNDVVIDGKCNFFFGARYSDRPTFKVGDNTGIGHSCSFTVGRQITIGSHCRIAGCVQMFDTPGHPADPDARRMGAPADFEDVRPIHIGDNVWIGSGAIIYPGVTIGDNSIVALGAVVMSSVPANIMVAGNPARQIRSLAPQTAASTTT
jgi:acetyltransferase-like isoleucine patch superfamily enzyme